MGKNEILIKNAVKYASKWQQEHKKDCKAFLIPTIDLVEALKDMGVLKKKKNGGYSLKKLKSSGIRTYVGIDPDISNGHGEKLLIVGTRIDSNGIHRDIVEGEKSSGCADGKVDKAVAALSGSGVFDVTKPCPNFCDPNSPLNNA